MVLGGFGEVIVLDWGLAKIVDQPEGDGQVGQVTLSGEAQTEATQSSGPATSKIFSHAGVLVFAGLTAWDTQRLKNEYIYGYAGEGDVAERSAILGALSLYLNFINLFTLLMQLLGQRE